MGSRTRVLTVLLLTACAPTRMRLPADSAEHQAGWPCVQQCHNQQVFVEKPAARSAAMRRCLQQCPGVVQEDGACRPQDRAGYGYCHDDTAEDPAGTAMLQGLAAGAVLLLLLIVYGVAKVGDDR